MKPSERLAELGISLPSPVTPVGSYLPANRCGSMVYTSGQLPMQEGKLVCTGKTPGDVSVEEAARGARLAMLNAVTAAAQACGGIDAIARVIRVCVFVDSSPGFTEQPKIANGASDLLVEIFGEAGKHARSAVGVAGLPLNATVEVELTVQVVD